ncbi:hypothetical protein NX059_008530 [Plenodomus lindquistii]|nr:hypothetical protein NX059_008530 [Plenodomus lindquistii]
MPPPPTPQTSPPLNQTPYFNTILNNPSTTNPSSPSPRSRPTRPVPESSSSSNFSTAQRSAQARHKEWNSSGGSGRASRSAESYEQRQERDRAATILDSEEMLLWFAAARNESVPQTRQYYLNIVLGLENNAKVEWREEWELPVQEKEVMASPARGAKGKEKERAKRRVSSAHHHA